MDTLTAVLGIVVIDLVLSSDNAIVIGMAAHRLPADQRRLAIVLGGGAAIVLRASLTAVAALLLVLPGLRAIGGVLLLWVAFRLLEGEQGRPAGLRPAASLRAAVLTILLADVVMSLDNILGVAGASGGNVALLLFGLVLSVTILMVGGSLVAALLNRLWWLAYLGAGIIAWTGIDMVLDDPFVARVGVPTEEWQLVTTAMVTLAVVALAHLVHRRGLARRP
jgi:YjbE family integral membrane protein